MNRPLLPVMVLVFVVSALLALDRATAEDVYFAVPLRDIAIKEGALPERAAGDTNPVWFRRDLIPRVEIVNGEGYVGLRANDALTNGSHLLSIRNWSVDRAVLVAKDEAGRALEGRVWVPDAKMERLVAVRFSVEASMASAEARDEFHRFKARHYEALLQQRGPGSAWHRHQRDSAIKQLPDGEKPDFTNNPFMGTTPTIDDTYGLFTGGRAVSENLQLTRELPNRPRPAGADNAAEAEKLVDVAAITGITVPSIDWKQLIGDAKPELDPLASLIPSDQHAVFFPSFTAFLKLWDEAKGRGLPIFRSTTLMGRSEEGLLFERYQQQLGLGVTDLARAFGPLLVKSVAITGSDPYFPTGTDVAVLFETSKPEELSKFLMAQIAVHAAKSPVPARAGGGEVDGVAYESWINEDRSVSSYIAVVEDAVVVTNSLEQLARPLAVKAGSVPSLATLDEYAFFRKRYPRGATSGDSNASSETALVVISDATIRRWCGPEWRIAASRRLRAGAILADLTAQHLAELQSGKAESREVASDTPMRTIGTLWMSPSGVRSSVFGSASFLTPIAEMNLTEVYQDEADSYKQWRDTYQRNWSWAFDPIALRLSIEDKKLSADLTVMPLILRSEYNFFAGVAKGVSIGSGGDPHDAIAHFAMALNRDSLGFRQGSSAMRMFAPKLNLDPLGWVGGSVGVYAEADPFWAELRESNNTSEFFQENADRVPVGAYVEVSSALKLTAFLAAARGFIEESAPGMAAWETRTHGERSYVRVGMTERAKAEGNGAGFDDFALYYAAMPRAIILSPSESLLKRAIDREAARPKKPARDEATDDAGGDAGGDARREAKQPDAQATAGPWLGESMNLNLSKEGFSIFENVAGEEFEGRARRQCWAAIEILNEWKRLFPQADPLIVHERWWGARPLCPAGGEFRWNAKDGTMESTVLGHPGDPKPVPKGLAAMRGIAAAKFGLTFEETGLRAKVEVIDE